MNEGGQRPVDVLVASGLLTPEQLGGLRPDADNQLEVIDQIIDQGILTEHQILRALSVRFETQFVSSQRLSKASFAQELLDRVPLDSCEQHGVFPVMYDAASDSLAVVCADPGNRALFAAVREASGARDVRPICARPAAIRAATRKHYRGEIHAFDLLDSSTQQAFHETLDTFERHLFDAETLASKAEEVARADSDDMLPNVELGRLAKLLQVLIGVSEMRNEQMRAHSNNVARYAVGIAEKLGIPQLERVELSIAAYLHDLGKRDSVHTTLISAAEHEQYRTLAEESYRVPLSHLEGLELPASVYSALERKYERFDGTGFPGRLAGKDIPLAARILALCESFDDLIENPRNVYGQTLAFGQALAVLSVYSETLFDPTLVEILKNLTTGSGEGAVFEARARLLIADPDVETTAVLELKAQADGYQCTIARDSDSALNAARENRFDVMVLEVELEPDSGFDLLQKVRGIPHQVNTPVIMVSAQASSDTVDRAFELKASDFVPKPFNANLLVAKIRQCRERYLTARAASRGVSGSLSEMGLPDLLQVLCQSRRTGKLILNLSGREGSVWLREGRVVQAKFGPHRAEDAVYRMLALPHGEFTLAPGQQPSGEEMDLSVDALLLEGMRRIDENLID